MILNPMTMILIDGLRPDGLNMANTPTLNRLAQAGRSTMSARTVFPSVTLPCITSIIHGVPPDDHGTIGNFWNGADWEGPGLIDLVHASGGRTAFFYNWEQLRDISRPGSLDISVCLNHAEAPHLALGESDNRLTDAAIQFISQGTFDYTFIYLGGVDTAGHRNGWMSPGYLQAVENADRCIERILRMLPPSAYHLICSDHGGHDHTHGSDDAADMLVPMIVHGPGISHRLLPDPISILDIAPTCAKLMGLDIPKEWVGRPLI
jgi:predicted AlkP superfamily pyrophosphatase or phosphodiesterase